MERNGAFFNRPGEVTTPFEKGENETTALGIVLGLQFWFDDVASFVSAEEVKK
jgi:hypothetical protein